MSTPAGWHGILEQGEEILWQGRPDQSFHLRRQPLGTMLFGAAFTAFALFWMVGAAQNGGLLWAFGLIHFSVGLGLTLGWPIRSALRRRGTWYTLTNRRALIATAFPWSGRELKSYVISEHSPLGLIEGPPDTVTFTHESFRNRYGTQTRAVGFEDIPEGRRVLALMRDMQTNRGPQ